jgi:hypothetical protein
MLLFGAALLTGLAPLASIEFLGSSLTFMMVYVWGRRHQYVNLSFLGIFNFTAPYLPWVLLTFSVMLGSSPKVDLLGMAAGEGRGSREGLGMHRDKCCGGSAVGGRHGSRRRGEERGGGGGLAECCGTSAVGRSLAVSTISGVAQPAAGDR